jgi:tRNA(Ile)-lysidine synthase
VVGGRIEALVAGDRIVVGPRVANGEPEGARDLPVPGGVEWGGGRIEARAGEPDGGEAIDRDRVEGALWVGPPAEGERFDPLGMGGKTQPLADFLRGRKIPRADRPGVPVVRDRAGIVWVAGHRIAHRVRRTDETRNILCLNWNRGGKA